MNGLHTNLIKSKMLLLCVAFLSLKKRDRNRPLYLQTWSLSPTRAFSAVNVLTSVDAVVRVQLVFQTELFGAVLTLMRFPRFVFLLTGLLPGDIAGSSERTSSTGLTCAEKNKNKKTHSSASPLTANDPVK